MLVACCILWHVQPVQPSQLSVKEYTAPALHSGRSKTHVRGSFLCTRESHRECNGRKKGNIAARPAMRDFFFIYGMGTKPTAFCQSSQPLEQPPHTAKWMEKGLLHESLSKESVAISGPGSSRSLFRCKASRCVVWRGRWGWGEIADGPYGYVTICGRNTMYIV